MPADDESARAIQQLRTDLRDDIAEVRSAINSLVSREVHEIQLARMGDRVQAVERDLDRLVAAIEADRKTTAERRSSDRRMVIGALLAAALSVAVQVLFGSGAMS